MKSAMKTDILLRRKALGEEMVKSPSVFMAEYRSGSTLKEQWEFLTQNSDWQVRRVQNLTAGISCQTIFSWVVTLSPACLEVLW